MKKRRSRSFDGDATRRGPVGPATGHHLILSQPSPISGQQCDFQISSIRFHINEYLEDGDMISQFNGSLL